MLLRSLWVIPSLIIAKEVFQSRAESETFNGKCHFVLSIDNIGRLWKLRTNQRLKNFCLFAGLRPDPLRFFYAYGILTLVAMDSASYGLFRFVALGGNCSGRGVSFQVLCFSSLPQIVTCRVSLVSASSRRSESVWGIHQLKQTLCFIGHCCLLRPVEGLQAHYIISHRSINISE